MVCYNKITEKGFFCMMSIRMSLKIDEGDPKFA